MADISPSDVEYEFDAPFFDSEDSLWTTGGGASWEDRENTITTGKIDLTSQVTKVHQVKIGAELKETHLNYHYVSGPYTALPNVEKYEHEPIEGSAYIQDKMENLR